MFVPNPLRCLKCQRFGHGHNTCRGCETCFRCGEEGHDGKSCQKDPMCKNCKGDHMSSSKQCPIWKKEKEILKVKTEKKITYPEAKRIVNIFENICLKNILTQEFENQLDPIQKFTEFLISIANKCIPKTSKSSNRIKKLWFTEDCKQAIKAWKKAERLFNKTPTLDKLNNFRIARAKARRTINQSKRKSWKNFVSNLNMHIPINKVWNAIRKIKGKGTAKNISI